MGFLQNVINSFKGRTYFISGSWSKSRSNSGNISDNAICNAIIDCNATHVAKGQIVHVLKDKDGRIQKINRSSEYTRLFDKPNPMMSRQDFIYALTWNLQIANTAFAWVKWDAGMHPVEIWPLVYLRFEVRDLVGGGHAVQFYDTEGQQYTVLVEDLIILRRKYDGKGYASPGNDQVQQSMEMVDSIDEGLKQAVEISNKIHGIIRQKNSMLATKSAEQTQTDFMNRMKSAATNGGVVSIDSTEEYTPLSVTAWSANAAQQKQINDRIYTFWRTPEEVVRNIATEQVMQNYYDSIVEPLWEEMSEAFTNALFTSREQGFGNQIIVYSSAATGASWQTKLSIITNTKDIGLLSTNEQRELIGYSPTEDGDDRYVSLNYVKSTELSKYQGTNDQNKEQTSEGDDENDKGTEQDS